MRRPDVLIVGGGPAGAAAALHLASLRPDLAHRTLLLDRAVFPRPKLCGGGVSGQADARLAQLGVQVDVPSAAIHAVHFVLPGRSFLLRRPNVFRVVRREEFDHALLAAVRQRGVEVREGEPVLDLVPGPDGVRVVTSAGEYRARAVVGADGARGIVRHRLGLGRASRMARLVEVLTPADPLRDQPILDGTAVIDFTPVARGVQGYYWDFPSLRQGVATINRGLFDARVLPLAPTVSLRPVLGEWLQARGLELARLELLGHPLRWFDAAARHSAPGVVLAGDAAGTDPLLGEGISVALGLGMLAAEAVCDAAARADYSFADYGQRLRRSDLGRALRWRRAAARRFYGGGAPWQLLLASLAVLAPGAIEPLPQPSSTAPTA